MTVIVALALLWAALKLFAGVAPARRRDSAARDLFERRLRDAGHR